MTCHINNQFTYSKKIIMEKERTYSIDLLKGIAAHPTKSVAGLNQTPTIPDRKRTECPLPHAVGF